MKWRFWKKEEVKKSTIGVQGKKLIVNPSEKKKELRNLNRLKKCKEKMKVLDVNSPEYLSFKAEYYRRKGVLIALELKGGK